MKTIKTPSAEHFDLDGITLEQHPETGERVFPDGEVYVQLEELEDVDDAIVVHSGAPETNQGLMHVEGVLELLKREGISTEVFFTYLPYSRQDTDFYEGTLNYAEALMEKLVDYYGVEKVYGVDTHFQHREWTDNFPFENFQAFELVEDVVDMDDYTVVVPDEGAQERFGIEGFSKERLTSRDVAVSGNIDLEGENVLVFDDMIATGGTMSETYDRVKELGAGRVEAAAVHGVMEEGVRKVSEKYDNLYLTNSVNRDASNVGIEAIISERII